MIGYLASILIFALVGAIAYRATDDLVSANSWVTHTFQVKSSLSELLVSMVNAETGERGFLLTADPRFLEPYQNGERDARRYFQQLRSLTTDNPRQVAFQAELDPMIQQRLNALAQLVENKRQGAKTIDAALLESGKTEMDDMRRLLGEMNAEEDALLEERRAGARQSGNAAKYSILLGGLAATVLTDRKSVV